MRITSITTPTAPPVFDQPLYDRVDEVARMARTAFEYSPIYWGDARDVGRQAAELGAALLSSLTGVTHDFAEQGLAYLQRGNATWGTTAKEPYAHASGLWRQAAEAMLGYHQPTG